MGFQSILFGNAEPILIYDVPDHFKDLQLDYLVERILEQTQGQGYKTNPYFYTFPGSAEIIRYRQQICKDMESEELCAILRSFCRRLAESRKIHNLSRESKGDIASATYHLQAATLYREAILKLEEDLARVRDSVSSDGMKDFFAYIKEELENQEAKGFVKALNLANSFFSELKFSLSMDTDKLVVTEEKDAIKKRGKKEKEPVKNYFEELAKLLGVEPEEQYLVMRDIFPEPLKVSTLEHVLVGILKKSKPKVFTEIKEFKNKFPEIYPKVLLDFEEEVQFYLSFQKFRARTLGMGYPMNMPELSENGEFSGREVYDIALVWKQELNDYEVVSNDFFMKNHPCFFVVTGPNQGGKTTFARSMGQAVYFALMGLPVNAEQFLMPMFNGISTHFEAEETLQSNSGKLKEEINRLIPMMHKEKNRNSFVVLNELFTTATTHDAMIMGRKVMESFLERNCYGIYVTHIQELAEEADNIISLVAQLEPGEENKRSYRMLPMKAQGYGYSDALVKKFHLEYEEIVRRLS